MYIILTIVILLSIYVILVFPYFDKLDNVRLIIHRTFIVTIVCMQLYVGISTKNKDTSSAFNSAYPWLMFVILFVNILVNGSYIIWKTLLWLKKPGIINMRMFVEQKGTRKKSLPVDYVPAPESSSFPKQ